MNRQLDPPVQQARRQRFFAAGYAALALLLGLVTIAGWSSGNASLVQIRPQWTPMVLNTAIGFVLSGCGLIAVASGRRHWQQVAALLGGLLVLLALEELLVLLFDISPALSLPEMHRALQPGYPHPGRMAPNTALCFLLFGSGLALLALDRAEALTHWVRSAAFSVLAIGLIGAIGYPLRLEFLYGWSGVVRMAAHTGIGMVVLGLGLWSLAYRERTSSPEAQGGQEVDRVYRIATVLTVLIAISAGIGGFAFLQGHVEQQVRDGLLAMSRDRALLFSQVIEHRSVRAEVVSHTTDLANTIRAARTGNASDANRLLAWEAHLHGSGFSAVTARVDGIDQVLLGPPSQSGFMVQLRGHFPGQVIWDQGFVLRRSLEMRDGAGVLAGVLVTEQRIPVLDELSAQTNRVGESGEMAVCAERSGGLDCFPLRSRPAPSRLPMVVAGQRLPMTYAVAGQSGSIVAFDYRQHRVLAAYGPVADTGLGLVVKRDIAEIYSPIRQQFQRIVLFLTGLVVLALWILRGQLRPLLQVIHDSRAQAMAAVESNLDAYFILECVRGSDGGITDFRYLLLNSRAERVLGKPRSEVIGQTMCELFPHWRSDGVLAKYAAAVESGTPVIEERSAHADNGMVRWYHVQAVKLGDGLGVTLRDVTTARHAAERIRHQAMHDPLTGLANRSGFELALAGAIADARLGGKCTALALLDVDGFKGINDTLGHAAGDHLLQELGKRLSGCVRPSDTVARLGGDEFVIVLPNISYPDGAEIVARKLINRVAQPMVIDGHQVSVTISVGVSAYPFDGVDALVLLKRADAAMYRAKKAGRNGYRISDAASA